jgi:TPR repeat protein
MIGPTVWELDRVNKAAAKRLYERGVAAANRGEFSIAVRLWRHVADQGYAKAQYNLGVAYALGKGVRKDSAEALKWWRRAAKQGHVEAERQIRLLETKPVDLGDAKQVFARLVSLVKAAIRWFDGLTTRWRRR